MEGMGARAERLVMVDLRSDRFTGALAHPGAECGVRTRPRRGIASTVSSDTTGACRRKE